MALSTITAELCQHFSISAGTKADGLPLQRVATRLYSETERGMKTTSIPVHQARACQPCEPTGWASRKPRTASTTCVMGWWLAKAFNTPGILFVITNALEAK